MKLNSANFNLDGFKSEIEKAINAATSETDRKKVIYHCSVTLGKEKEKNQHYLQLIIVDRFEYKELSSNLMEQLRESMLNKNSQSQSKFYFISGTAFTPNASGHVFTFIFGSLFL
ncbi:hypothetical protein PVAND_009243 [Polypedilum vanderplanki]|uniref:Uncharacterized protein n=1 Tax=Polypedilum vanderplanki TaxID=319348 RepID=A0A9J6CCA4_POLVA|nr:hypothetical protein PVAND_009243 [Polypedilum vanderplanki]